MKIAIIGYSGSGKSTLARALGAFYGEAVLHLDTVQFLPNWQVRSREEKERIVADFLDAHAGWVIDGNYTKLSYDRRMQEADRIVMLLFPRLSCLWRVTRRYRTYRNRTRPDMTVGCNEKLDREFVAWVLWKGRRKDARNRYAALRRQYPDKVTVLKRQRDLDRFLDSMREEKEWSIRH